MDSKPRHRSRYLAILAIIAVAFGSIPSSHEAHGIEPVVARLEAEADVARRAGDYDLALRRLDEAHAEALRLRDWDGLLFLTLDYLVLSPLETGHPRYVRQAALESYYAATSIAYDLAVPSPDRPGSGSNCPEGLRRARIIVRFYDRILVNAIPDDEIDDYQRQRDIADSVNCNPNVSPTPGPTVTLIGSPTATPPPTPTPTVASTPSPTPTVEAYPWDQMFTPRYLMHAVEHGTLGGTVQDDYFILYTQAPDAEGKIYVPDGSGGTFTYKVDQVSGPYSTARQVCAALAGAGSNYQAVTDFSGERSFDCSLLTS